MLSLVLLLPGLGGEGIRASSPAEKIVPLLQGGLGEWRLRPTETARIEIAPSNARLLWQGEDEEPIAAIGQRGQGGRVVVFSDRAFFDPGNSTDKAAREALLNCLRWAGGGRAPKVGLGSSLEDLVVVIEEEEMRTRQLGPSQLVDQVDVYCLLVAPETEFSVEDRNALERFAVAGGGIVLAGCGGETQMALLNSLVSPAGIRFTDSARVNPKPVLLAVASTDGSETISTTKATPSGSVMTIEGATTPSPLIVERPVLALPPSAEGPTGAVLQMIREPGKRGDGTLIEEMRGGTGLSGDDLAVFQEALHQLNQKVGPILPTEEQPIIPGADPLVDAIMEIETELNDRLPAEQIRRIPAADNYPGPVSDDAPRVSKIVSIDVNYRGWLPRNNGGGARASEWRPTGLYAPPGEVIRVSVPANLADKGLSVRIGAYGGILSEEWEKLTRYRQIARNFPIDSKTVLAANGFGGIVTILVPRGMKGDEPDWREITIEGAVEAPLFVYGQTAPEEWEEIRRRPGPWAELASDRMILTLPSEAIRDLRNPDEVMQMWNEIVESTAVLAVLDRDAYRAERIVFDRQLSNPGVGLHAGQPIAAHTGRAVETAITPELMHSPRAWGFLHELGHVHQDAAWGLPGSTEASCNLWSVYVSEELLGVPRAEAHRSTESLTRRNTMKTYFRNGANFDSEWERATALESYLQIQESFGWEAFQRLFESYQDYDDPRRWNEPQEVVDEWVLRLSEICGVDLAPFYRTWGLAVSDRAAAKTASLPAWEEDPTKPFRNR